MSCTDAVEHTRSPMLAYSQKSNGRRMPPDFRMSIDFLASSIESTQTSYQDDGESDLSRTGHRVHSQSTITSPHQDRHENSELSGETPFPLSRLKPPWLEDAARCIEPPPRPRADSFTLLTTISSPSGSDDDSLDDGGRLWRTPRAPRPSYSEEQKFFIMFCRVVKDMDWLGIEDAFCDTFRYRSKGGLTSVYYRIRRSWGLEEVLRGTPDTSARDREVVNMKAANFSNDYLVSIGYLR